MADAPPTQLGPGSEFAGYWLEALIGRGGMGDVYEAMQISLQRRVAVKVLSPQIADDVSFRERFRREQRLMASLDHVNILPIYEAGEREGHLYIAMRLVEGGTLKTVINNGERDPLRVSTLVAQAAAALDAAHEAGLVHRDVKPQNMLVDTRDHLYLSDFGLAAGGTEASITRAGQFVGTLDYVAPEQIRGEPVTPAADIYALGCVLYEALTGSVPFIRASDAGLLFAHISDPCPRPTEGRPELSPEFDAVIATAMAKEPAERYRSAGMLAIAAVTAANGGREAADVRAVIAPPAPVPAPLPSPPRSPSPPPQPTVDVGAAPPPARAGRFWPRLFSRPPGRRSNGKHSHNGDEPASALPPPPPPPEWGVAPTYGGTVTMAAPAPPRFQLKPGFRYIHEPLADDRDGIPLLGNAEIVALLKERIVHSNGGAFLITGFRGVGKTTVISRALADLKREDDRVTILPVRINVARPRTVEELLFEIIRRVFETLKDEQLLGRMSPHVQRELLLAYARTSLSFNETRSNAQERTRGFSVGLPSLIEALTPKLEASRKTTDSLATQAAFLAYTDADVEHDFLRIVSLVEQGDREAAPAEHARGRRRTPPPPPPTWQGKLVVVIDELDKLTADEEGMRCVDTLLAGLKNLLTARGVHFLFVAGPDLHDVALRESRRGNSVYESVFSWQFYVPCVWEATDRLLDAVMEGPAAQSPRIEPLRDYLRFKSRGVPRLLLMELNSFVRWTDDGGAYLEVGGPERARLQFYADLERVVRAFVGEEDGGRPLVLAIDQDRWKLGAYYVTDWILQSDGVPFTVDELVGAEQQLALHPVFTLSRAKVRDFLAHLVKHDIVRLTAGQAPDRTYQGDVPGAQQDVFQLAPEYRVKLSAFARANERERADLGAAGPHNEPWADSEVGGEVGHNRYELLEELDRAGLGHVYRARDKQTFQECAIKLYDRPDAAHVDIVRARFERAAEIARSLSHPNIVPTLDTFQEDGRLGIVMALVAGTPLSQLLGNARLTPHEAVTVASRLCDALEHVHERGVARLDLKPSSILVDEELTPVILDLGLAKVIGDASAPGRDVTAVGAVLGTPAYAAPEQLRGREADIRSDIYALGLILYEMIAGRRARRGGFSAVVAQQEAHVDLERLDVSDGLRAAISTALAGRPEDRYPTPSAMRVALAATPEATG